MEKLKDRGNQSLENREIKFIKETYQNFEYFADNVSAKYKEARKFFAHDRNLTARELDLIILNYLYNYEFNGLKDRPLCEYITSDPGLLQLLGIFERIKGMAGVKEKLIDNLPAIHNLYSIWRA